MSHVPYPTFTSPCFIGVDSDGTVFDTMEIKHKRVFQPLAVELWGLQAAEAEFNGIAETINLYSVHRGVNRFQGLAMAFERLAEQSGPCRYAVSGCAELREFVLSGVPMSNNALAEYNATRKSPFLDKVLEWSQRSDELYARIMEDEGNPPFCFVRECLERASRRAEIMVVSSSSREALMQDWGHGALLPLTTRVMGQDMGSKTKQLESAIAGKYPASRALMIGDAMGDLEAAGANGILFYPIVPGAEQQSWERFQNEAMERFFQGTYAGDYEEKLLVDFQSALGADDPWPRPVPEVVCMESTPGFPTTASPL